MSEPHSNGGRGKSSSSEDCANNHHHQHHHSTQSIKTHAAATHAVIPLDAAITSCRPGHPQCTSTSPISPPTSPTLTSCLASQHHQNHPVDMLAFRLRNQSLIPPIHPDSHGPKPSAALSPTSLPDDDYVAPSIVPDDDDAVPMQIDDIEYDCAMSMSSRFQRRSYRRGLADAAVPPPHSGPSDIIQPSPTTNDTLPATESGSSNTGQTLYGNALVIESPEIEVDEDYCEGQDDRAWIESIMSLRQTNGPGGIRKRYGLKYRSSSEAASRCQNSVHSVPRMRRRDKTKKKRLRRLESDASISTTASVSALATPQ